MGQTREALFESKNPVEKSETTDRFFLSTFKTHHARCVRTTTTTTQTEEKERERERDLFFPFTQVKMRFWARCVFAPAYTKKPF